ncbi:hypothetical protein BJV78DRAFT_1242051, partial [Lactifluus subvellereus]
MVQIRWYDIFVLDALGALCTTVLVKELPNPMHSIGFLRSLQLAPFVGSDVPRKLFVWPAQRSTVAYAWGLCELPNHKGLTSGSLYLASAWPSVPKEARVARRRCLSICQTTTTGTAMWRIAFLKTPATLSCNTYTSSRTTEASTPFHMITKG